MKLFVYGTLMQKDVLNKIFNRDVQTKDAILENYILDMSDEYYNIVSLKNHEVVGKVIDLTTDELLLADQWEEVPYYYKNSCQVIVDDKRIDALVYIKSAVENTGICIQETISTSKSENSFSNNANLMEDVSEFILDIDMDIKKSDLYFMVPVRVNDLDLDYDKMQLKNIIGNKFVEVYNETVKEEYDSQVIDAPNHIYIGDYTLSIFNDEGKRLLVKTMIYLGYSTLESDTYGALYISVLVSPINPTLLWARIYSDSFEIDGKKFSEFLTSLSVISGKMEQIGSFKCVCFSSSEWEIKHKVNLFAAEYNCGSIKDTAFKRALSNNLAQYETASIYANEIAILETPKNYSVCFSKRMSEHILTLFIVELFILQFAISNETKIKLIDSLNCHYKNKVDNQDYIMLMTKNYWSSGCFVYPTAHNLMNSLGEALKADILYEVHNDNLKLLSRSLETINELKKDKNANLLNKILLFLTLISIFPVIFNLISEFAGCSKLLGYSISATSCLAIYIVYSIVSRR